MKKWFFAVGTIFAATCFGGCTPSPEKVCAKVFELLEADMKDKKDDEKKFMEAMMKAFKEDCVKEATKEKEKDGDAYKKAANCVMDAKKLEEAMKCDFGKGGGKDDKKDKKDEKKDDKKDDK